VPVWINTMFVARPFFLKKPLSSATHAVVVSFESIE
jgi:hypothetical protein